MARKDRRERLEVQSMAKKRPPAKVTDFLEAIIDESDRGCVLVSAAWLEDQMREFIESVLHAMQLHGPYKLPAEMLETLTRKVCTDALGGAFDRVDFCRLVGAIDDDTESALRTVLTMRNHHFAHFAGVSVLSDPKLTNHLTNLRNSLASWSFFRMDLSEDVRRRGKEYSPERIEFMNGAITLSLILLKTRTPLAQFARDSKAKADAGIDFRKQDTQLDEPPQGE